MKREAILKIILVLIAGVVLFAKPVNVVAASSEPADINDIFGWEDQTGSITDTDTNTNTNTNTDTNTNTNTSTSTDTNTNTSTNTSTSTPSTTTPSTTTPSTNTNTSTSTSTSTNTSTKTDLPKAGLVEDTMMIIAIIALISVAVFTFVKVSDYSNI